MKKWRLFENLIQFERWSVSYHDSGIKSDFQTFAIFLLFIAGVAVKSQIIDNILEISYSFK